MASFAVEYLADGGIKRSPSGSDAFNIILGASLISTAAGIAVVAPFFLVDSIKTALNISNILGILMLFVIGYNRVYEKSARDRMIMGFGTAIIGIVIAVITILLGG